MHGRAAKERYCTAPAVPALAGGTISYSHPFQAINKIKEGLETAGNIPWNNLSKVQDHFEWTDAVFIEIQNGPDLNNTFQTFGFGDVGT